MRRGSIDLMATWIQWFVYLGIFALAIKHWIIVLPIAVVVGIIMFFNKSSTRLQKGQTPPVAFTNPATTYSSPSSTTSILAAEIQTDFAEKLRSFGAPQGCVFGETSKSIPPSASDEAPTPINSGFARIDKDGMGAVGRISVFAYTGKIEATNAYARMISHYLHRYVRPPTTAISGIGEKCEINVSKSTNHQSWIYALIQNKNLVIHAVFPSDGEDFKEYLIGLNAALTDQPEVSRQ